MDNHSEVDELVVEQQITIQEHILFLLIRPAVMDNHSEVGESVEQQITILGRAPPGSRHWRQGTLRE
jgi:hypothetical protein